MLDEREKMFTFENERNKNGEVKKNVSFYKKGEFPEQRDSHGLGMSLKAQNTKTKQKKNYIQWNSVHKSMHFLFSFR